MWNHLRVEGEQTGPPYELVAVAVECQAAGKEKVRMQRERGEPAWSGRLIFSRLGEGALMGHQKEMPRAVRLRAAHVLPQCRVRPHAEAAFVRIEVALLRREGIEGHRRRLSHIPPEACAEPNVLGGQRLPLVPRG